MVFSTCKLRTKFSLATNTHIYQVICRKELLGANPAIRPVVNQLEIHPWNTRTELVDFCTSQNIKIEAYSPLTKGRKLDDSTLVKIASKYDKTPAQVLIRWSIQHGYIVLPKSVTPERIASNADVYDFDLSDSDMNALDDKDEYLLTGSVEISTML
jgi:diketogulonate reductase-like aldo/keto reductase